MSSAAEQLLGLLRDRGVLRLPFRLPPHMDLALAIQPGTVVYRVCWTPAGDEVQIIGHLGGGQRYSHIGQADNYSWLGLKQQPKFVALRVFPLGSSEEDAEAEVVVDVATRACWVVMHTQLQCIGYGLPESVMEWLRSAQSS